MNTSIATLKFGDVISYMSLKPFEYISTIVAEHRVYCQSLVLSIFIKCREKQ